MKGTSRVHYNIKDINVKYMSKVVKRHPEIELIKDYDNEKLNKLIKTYRRWYKKHAGVQGTNEVKWANSMHSLMKDLNDHNYVKRLTTEAELLHGQNGYSYTNTKSLLTYIDDILQAIENNKLEDESPQRLEDILIDLHDTIRNVTYNTSIIRLHQRSWAQSDAIEEIKRALQSESIPDVLKPDKLLTRLQNI